MPASSRPSLALTKNYRDRRRHVVYVTHHTEYHCRDRECVAVRDRLSGQWHRRHPAVRSHLLGGVGRGRQVQRRPELGTRLVFRGGETIMTSRLVFSGRPEQEALFYYTSLQRAGIIGA